MFISFKLFSLLHTHHFSCHGVLSTGDWHLIHESENSLPENLDGLQTEILSLQVSQGTWKYLLDAYPLRIGAQFHTAQNCVYFVDHVFAASRLFRFPTRIPSFSCLSATHATCINRTNGPVAVAQTDRTKHRLWEEEDWRQDHLCSAAVWQESQSKETECHQVSFHYHWSERRTLLLMYCAVWSFEDKAKQDWSLVLNPRNLP